MKLLPVLFLAAAAVTCPAAPVISEFLADNDGGLKDENGDDEDWIEIHNPDPVSVNLAGWRLSNDAADPEGWSFPARILPPGGRLLVWASGKDRRPLSGNLHTDFRLDNRGEYLALISPSGQRSTEFAPVFHFQPKNRSFGWGYAGTVTVTDATPQPLSAGVNWNRQRISGPASATSDASLNVYDDGLAQPEHQQYLWFDYSSRLAAIPAGQSIAEATLEWTATAMPFAGVSNLSTVPASIGIFPVTDSTRGLSSVATTADGKDFLRFFSANQPTDAISILPGETRTFTWNVTSLIRDWRSNPQATGYGQFMLIPSAHPCWIAWDQNRSGPRLTVRTVSSPNPTEAWGFMTPSPALANTGVTAAGPLVRHVTENPPQPPAATPFTVTAAISRGQGGPLATATLIYRRNYEAEISAAMTDDGTSGDAVAGDGIFSATIPASIMTAGRMIRWRVRATDTSAYQTILPTYADPIDSPQYFGTVPQDAAVQTQLMVVHRFVQNTSAAQTAAGTRASIYLNGEFYDNVGINLHGQSTSGGAFLKKSYDIDGNRGYRFKWSTDPSQPPAKDINLLTVYADKTKIRHDLAYEMNRAAGVAAHYCFLTHNRLNGTFDGLYSFVEDADDVYLTRAGLNPDGALYKMYNGMTNPATDAITGVEKKTRKLESNFDLHQFLQGMHQPGTAAQRTFFFDNLDVPKMINFMAANTVTGNVDLHAKNYYIYCDTGRTNLWTLLPWDLDLSQGRLWTAANNYFDDGIYLNAGGTLSGQGQNLIAKLYAIPEFSAMARRRIRSLQDQFFGTRNAAPDLNRWYDRRVSEKAAEIGARIVSGQNDIPGSDAAADFSRYTAAQWKNHTGVTGNTANSIYASYTASQEIQRLLSSWVLQRVNTINGDASVPQPYNLAALNPLVFTAVEHSPASGDQSQEFIELRNPNTVDVDLSGWQINGGVAFTFEPGTVVNANGRIIVAASRNGFKTRTVSPKAGESRYVTGGYKGNLSNLGETITLTDPSGTPRATYSYQGQPSPWQAHLVITEIMYHPAGDGLAEYIELTNISRDITLDLTGVRFTQGVAFSFSGSAVTSLPPGGRVLVVRDAAAFTSVHGNGLPVAGVFADATQLANSGEILQLEDPLNQTIAEFAYDDAPPWPSAADGTGPSLVLIRPESKPDPSIAANWRLSAAAGNPGTSDTVALAPGTESQDLDGDGIPALMEYAMGSSDTVPGAAAISTSRGSADDGTPFLEVTFPRQTNAEDATLSPESSADLATWSPSGWTWQESAAGTNGSVTERWRLTGPDAARIPLFLRVKATRKP